MLRPSNVIVIIPNVLVMVWCFIIGLLSLILEWAAWLRRVLRPLHFENEGDVDEKDEDDDGDEEKIVKQLTCTCRQPSLRASRRSAFLKAALLKTHVGSRVWIHR